MNGNIENNISRRQSEVLEFHLKNLTINEFLIFILSLFHPDIGERKMSLILLCRTLFSDILLPSTLLFSLNNLDIKSNKQDENTESFLKTEKCSKPTSQFKNILTVTIGMILHVTYPYCSWYCSSSIILGRFEFFLKKGSKGLILVDIRRV